MAGKKTWGKLTELRMTPRSQKGFTMSHCCPLYFSLDTRHSTIIRVNPKFSRSSFYIYKHIQNTWKYWSCQAGSYTGVPQVLAASWGQCRMFNGNPNCDAASHPVPKFGVKDYEGLSRTIKDYQGLSSGFKWIQVAVAQCLSLKVMKLFLKGLDGLDLVGAWGRQSESCAALERNVHYRGITVEIDIHIRYYSIIHVQYVYTYKLYIWIANWNLCKGHPVISTAIQKHDIWLHSLQLPWLHSRLSIQLCSSSCMVLMSSAWPTTHNS